MVNSDLQIKAGTAEEMQRDNALLDLALTRACYALKDYYCPKASRCTDKTVGCAMCIKEHFLSLKDELHRK